VILAKKPNDDHSGWRMPTPPIADISPARERREAMRAQPDLARAVVGLTSLEPGGSFDRPLEVTSASEVDVRAQSIACPLCSGACRLVEEHRVVTRADVRRRLAEVACVHCGAERQLWFRVGTALPS
jgi:hypothetical protein